MFTQMTREEKAARLKRDRPWIGFAIVAITASVAFSAFSAKAETVERARFTVDVVGKGPDVILIPGLVSDRAVWADTVKSLSSSHRLHLVQVRGFNGVPTGANAEGPVLEPLVEDLNGYIRDKGLKTPVIVGHSMGGATGVMLSARHPDAVKQVVVVDSAPFMPALFNPAATAETAKAQVAPMLKAVRDMPAEPFAAQQKMSMRMQTKDPAKADMIADWSVKSDRSVMVRAMEDLMSIDLRPELKGIKAQITVLIAWDPMMQIPADAYQARWEALYAGTPRLSVKRIDNSFHFIMFDQPAAFDAALRDALAGN